MKKYVAVAGNIGVGKSTLVEMLCVRLGWEPFYEPVTENPYLSDFYKDMDAWSFHSHVWRELSKGPTTRCREPRGRTSTFDG